MKKWVVLAAGLVVAVVAAAIFVLAANYRAQHNTYTPAQPNQARSKGMKLTSTAFFEGAAIPARYSCQGEGMNPPLTVDGVPGEARVLALVVDDPDAPGGTFDHWVLWNLPTTMTEIPENWRPEPGVSVGANGLGKNAWTPPCPPSGVHRYHFKLYALDQKLDLAEGSSKGELISAMEGHIVAQVDLVGTYSKR